MNRLESIQQWLSTRPELQHPFDLSPLAGDASFRRYFRIQTEHNSYVLMDAPPEKEPLAPFIQIATLIEEAGVKTPTIIAQNQVLGLLLLEDFGDELFYDRCKAQAPEPLYQEAIKMLIELQSIPSLKTTSLPSFDASFIAQELALFPEWYLKQYLKLSLSPGEHQLIQNLMQMLINHITQHPRVFIHRDFHSRNLMYTHNNTLGVIDFQDAMIGPLTYDLVSLLKDCYIQWSEDQIMSWLQFYHTHSPIAQSIHWDTLSQQFEWNGLQRHLKVLGIFSRLFLRDNKPRYLNDLPLTQTYVMNVLERRQSEHPILHDFLTFMMERVIQS